MTDLTARLAPAADADVAALRDRLATRAEAEGLLDVRWRVVDSPVGELLLAASDRGLVRVAFAAEGFDAVLATLATALGSRVLRAPRALDPVAGQLEEYFARRRQRFEVAVDLRLSSPFRRRVQEALPGIGFGRTASYAEVAALVGSPGAVRAVGSACATNPVPVVVPCHRVVRSDGAMGGYRGGPEAKRALLALEAA
ncbi:methylated-DNA--[protein]-cysteine S-methyltransferase [Desertihabitans brevis]|uniref:Methylated-DNA--protein-cysteine methyltransferase n=1 Tax=Desertihabitans brevis TaxID=2268447 RepID=A0A367YVY0_9ACTN|nr:methylated-DNA--[protein]-cysteine S-methyltransferase [Desertihabitans brevis]RCK70034.1 methylated-DNA--[protein]-cysteine S-methyltransferase [Desertihabitans brevis]